MGSFFTDVLSFQHETAVFDVDPKRLRFVYNTYRYTTATVKYTLDAFHQVLPALPKDCIISDIASVKTGLKEFYDQCGFRYVSTHPMFGPTFANLGSLSSENAIIIKEGDYMGRIFFRGMLIGICTLGAFSAVVRTGGTLEPARAAALLPARAATVSLYRRIRGGHVAAADLQPVFAAEGPQNTGKTLASLTALQELGLIEEQEGRWLPVPVTAKQDLASAPVLQKLAELAKQA